MGKKCYTLNSMNNTFTIHAAFKKKPNHQSESAIPLHSYPNNFFFTFKDDSKINVRCSNVQHVWRNSVKNDSVIVLAMKNLLEISHENFFLN